MIVTTGLVHHLTNLALNIRDAIRTDPPPDEEVPDLIANIDQAIGVLREVRSLLLAEVTGNVDGTDWRIVERRSARRSYNTGRLLGEFAAKMADDPEPNPEAVLARTIRHLSRVGALKLVWQWTALRREAERQDVTLTIASHEIEDGDPDALVGEVWSSEMKVEPRHA
jgi:hypothetical protein